MDLNKKIYSFVLYIFLINLVFFLIKFSTNHAYGKTYKVKNVEIIEPYEINFNKSEVIDKAINKGFQELMLKITSSKYEKRLTNVNLKEIKN